MEEWLRERLIQCLNFDIPDDMIKYILSIKTAQEFDTYFDSLLNKDSEDHRIFLNDCKRRLFNLEVNTIQTNQVNQTLQRKQEQMANGDGVREKQDNRQIQGCRKKTKYVNLYTTDGNIVGDTVMLKGRHWCNCQATRHKLINNCLSCGRIVCAQEGSGSCLFCGDLVMTNEEQKSLQSLGKNSRHHLKSVKEKTGSKALKEALEQRDRLLDYDRNSENRTTVIDDELDYFEENSVWLSEQQRAEFERIKQEINESKHGSRVNRKIKIDFAGRVLDEDKPMDEYIHYMGAKLNTVLEKSNSKGQLHNSSKDFFEFSTSNPNIQIERPLYMPSLEEVDCSSAGFIPNDHLEKSYNRIQDKELMEMQDMRQCLSVHQPWASLLVAGIKKHEGRVWYSEHRGRLWIASTAKEPRIEEIKEAEDFYKLLYKNECLKFPEFYPSGCLLGCIKLEECLPQEEYRNLYPDGESESPYVFICSQAEQLPVAIPFKGQHKIYQMDVKIHNTAWKTLMRLKTK